jgi:excinuclease ABC subunit A
LFGISSLSRHKETMAKGQAKRKDRTPAEAFGFDDGVGARTDELIIEGLRQNNLRDLSLSIPHDRITAVVGPSGSGKSSLAFDTLFAEGRWRFMESLSTYSRLFIERMDRPELDSIRNIRPAIALEQKNPVRGSRSTVGTATELNDYLRLLFARVGVLFCPDCDEPVSQTDPVRAAERLIDEYFGAAVLVGFTMDVLGSTPESVAGLLLEKGYIRAVTGGRTLNLTEDELPPDLGGALRVVTDRLVIRKSDRTRLVEAIETGFREGDGSAWVEVLSRDGNTGEQAGESIIKISSRPICPGCSRDVERPTPGALSFNHPVGACPNCKGFGNVLRYDTSKVIPDATLTLREGAVEPWTKPAYRWWYEEMEQGALSSGLDLDTPFEDLTDEERRMVFEGADGFEGLDGFFDYLESKKYKLHIKVFSSRYKGQVVCAACRGARLKPQALSVRLAGLNIAEASAMSIARARDFFLDIKLSPIEKEMSTELIRQINATLDFLNATGLGYVTLDRLSRTLSGGEAQRVQLATQLASTLSGVLYILDEPSIGLHPVDIEMLITQLKKLANLGNTVVVVEHDHTVIRAADHIVELGPGAGAMGGRLVYNGPATDFVDQARTLTADYLTGRERIHVPRWRRSGSGREIRVTGAAGNNLKGVDLAVPMQAITCVTGVSGSGKSTLVVDTLYNIAARHFNEKGERPLTYRSAEGFGGLGGVKLVDQSPIGRTPRSNPLTYIGGFDEIRRIYASMPASRMAALTPGHFSFNVPGGRCEACRGEGSEKLEMYFLPDVYIRCAECGGKRYRPFVLDVRFRGRNIFDCLEMTFDEASALFRSTPGLQRVFGTMNDVGLGYLKLGQSATTLSGGEAQRLKLARELASAGKEETLYILDEPTTGLHADDTKKLLSVLGRLADAGNTVVMIEHNLDCIKTADHIIDLGPGGGNSGGTIVATGTPEEVAGSKKSLTARYLKEVLD